MADRFESEAVWKPEGRGFNMGIIQPEGRVVHLTGQVAWDMGGNLVGRADVRTQTHQCFENIRHLLNEIGGTLADIVSVTTYFVNIEDLPIIQEVRTGYFSGINAPVSTSIRVAGLGHPEFLVELTPISVIPEQRFKPPARKIGG